MISRLVHQKGFDLVAEVIDELPELGATFVVLGTGERQYEEMWRSAARKHPARIGVQIGYDETLAHLIEAGSDMFLMSSRYEPCGLNQMYWVYSTGRRNTSMMRCCDAGTETEKVRPGGSTCDAFAWPAAGSGACGAATVLEGDHPGAVE